METIERNLIEIDFELLWKKKHGSLNAEEERLFHAWLARDDRHNEYYQQFLNDKLPDLKVDTQKAWKMFDQATQQPVRKINWVGIAASVILICCLVIFWNQQQTKDIPLADNVILDAGSSKAILLTSKGEIDISSGHSSNQLGFAQVKGGSLNYQASGNSDDIEEHTLIIPRGGEFELVLPDGTRVWLNAESKLTYPSLFTGTKRIVALEGEAYFDVKHDSLKPFQVRSNDQTITVLGTEFNVSTYQPDRVVTTLVEGSVSIDAGSDETKLAPGEQAIYDRESKAIDKQEVDVTYFTTWKDGAYFFQNEPLENILITLSRWYDIEFRFASEEQRALRLTGRVKKYENLEKFLTLLEKTNEVTFQVEKSFVVVE